jgi:hypothetical protein
LGRLREGVWKVNKYKGGSGVEEIGERRLRGWSLLRNWIILERNILL